MFAPTYSSLARFSSLFAFVSSSQLLFGGTRVFTDRESWNEAVSDLGTVTLEDFNDFDTQGFASDTPTELGDLLFEFVNTSGGIRSGSRASAIDGTQFFGVRLDGNPIMTARMEFPFPVLAWGMDYRHTGDQTHVTFGDVTEMPIGRHNTTGFIGFISDSSFEEVQFTDPFISFNDFVMDNLVFVEAFPVFEKIEPIKDEGVLTEVQVTYGSLRSDVTYQLMRSTDLEEEFVEVDRGIPAESSRVFSDFDPPRERAFYRLEAITGDS